jgi:phosphoribosyl-ATP pyrophosphohydrolase
VEELIKLIESNAKSISALTTDIQEMKKDRDFMYDLMRDLTQKEIKIYDVLQNLDGRQQQLTNQQQQLANQQQQLLEIIKILADK